MAKKSSAKSEKSLVIVESPAKARTISKFLGSEFVVEASIGHVRDLPKGAKEVPEAVKKEEWAYLGVNVNEEFKPIYIVPDSKKQQVTKLKKALKESSDLYLATDEDREGEAISWHLLEILKPKVPVHRLVFHEITKTAIQNAIENPRDIDEALVKAQETRRILDRLYGYDVSQLLWRKVGPKLSAGRVQSVAVRLIVERERERMAFVSSTYWDLIGQFAKLSGENFEATLVSVDDRKVPRAKDFDSTTGKIKDPNLLLLDEKGALELAERLANAEFKVANLDVKPFTERPKPPFTTSTLQQEANRKLNFTARRAMNAAQSLYENGYITYMRTDSTTLADVAVKSARDLVKSEYGDKYLYDTPRVYASKVKNAQEAHEAIRPAGADFPTPQSLQKVLKPDEFKLYDLIWKRTVASQMADAKKRRITIAIEGDGARFQVSGTTIDFEGFLRAYVEGSDDPEAELADKETLLPAVEKGEVIQHKSMSAKSHTTQPPSRFSEATLTRTLEERGIGRPSTYASIIETIQERTYVFKKGNALVPSWVAFSVIRLLEDHFPNLVDYEFTAQMEDFLDSVSRREAEHLRYLKEFYFGNGKPGLKENLKSKETEIDPRLMSRFPVGTPTEGEFKEEIVLRVGKYGPFVEQGERKASLPDGMAPDELNMERALELLEAASIDEEPIGTDPETQKPVYIKQGRFGPYVQLGTKDDDEKPKNASLLRGMAVEDVTFEIALKLLALPRTLGEHPEMKEPVQAFNGRFGPYIKCGTETRSLPAEVPLLEVNLEQAIEILKQPKTRGRGRAAPKEPIKTFEKSPVTEEPIKLLDGRYGPYVTDGETNASLPKGTDPSELTFDQAVNLLAERAAKAPAKKKKKKKAAKKKTAKKKTAKKTAAKKKTATKKTTKKATTKKKTATKKTAKKKTAAEKTAVEDG